jgi:hypothetical protein
MLQELNASRPFLGAPANDLRERFGVTADTRQTLGRWSVEGEAQLQRYVCAYEPAFEYQTRSQTMLAVHRTGRVVFGQREVLTPQVQSPWTMYAIDGPGAPAVRV